MRVWVDALGGVPGRERGFSAEFEREEAAIRWRFDLYWGGNCVVDQPCNRERRFRIAVHEEDKVRCETVFSNLEIERPHSIDFELIQSEAACRLQKRTAALSP